jgi:four helix bundle protein
LIFDFRLYRGEKGFGIFDFRLHSATDGRNQSMPGSEQSKITNRRILGGGMTEDELKRRTKQFALRVITLVGALPRTVEGRAVGNQLIRAGTSVGANYRAACRGRSRADFVAKLGIVEEEADESAYWLELVTEAEMMKKSLVEPLLKEANELVAIIVASRKSAGK